MSDSITPPLSQKSADRKENPGKPRVSSKGKRLLALLLDFILALLLVNTMEQFFRTEHWDLAVQAAAGQGDQRLMRCQASRVLPVSGSLRKVPRPFLRGSKTKVRNEAPPGLVNSMFLPFTKN